VKRTREVSAQLARQVTARQRALELATQRFEGELASYFEVLDAQRELFPSELQLAAAKREEHVAVVRLYRALGGGWQSRAALPATAAGASAAGAAPPAGCLPAQPPIPAPR
jgi:multidrug efflux system outer membrane protein